MCLNTSCGWHRKTKTHDTCKLHNTRTSTCITSTLACLYMYYVQKNLKKNKNTHSNPETVFPERNVHKIIDCEVFVFLFMSKTTGKWLCSSVQLNSLKINNKISYHKSCNNNDCLSFQEVHRWKSCWNLCSQDELTHEQLPIVNSHDPVLECEAPVTWSSHYIRWVPVTCPMTCKCTMESTQILQRSLEWTWESSTLINHEKGTCVGNNSTRVCM